MKKIVPQAYLIMVLMLPCFFLHAQREAGSVEGGRLSPKELTISASPVFDLMGVTPSQVNRTTDIKDFKVDWLFKSWKLNPNLGIQSQPVWEILYNRKDLNKYQRASSFMRKMASLDVSIGSIQNEEGDRRMGFSTKLNLYKAKDPLMAKDLYADIGEMYTSYGKELEAELLRLKLKLDTARNILERHSIRNLIDTAKAALAINNIRRREEINNRASIFIGENWNASSIDIAFGKVNTYKTDSSGSLKDLRLNRNTGWGAWLNGNVGLGKNFLLSGLFRYSWYQDEVNFKLKNSGTGEEIAHITVADNKLFTMGVNVRYGGPIYTFFMEILYEQKGLSTAIDAINDAFKTPTGNFTIVESSAKWNVVHPNTISIGGDWRMSRNLTLNYGMRCGYDNNWKFTTFTPVATISCMMR